MTTYFDSSVLVKAYCLETTSPQALTLIRRAEPPLLFTPLHAIEIKNALRLKRHRKELTQFQLRGALENLQHDIHSGFLHMPDLDVRAVFDHAEFLSAAHTAVIGARSLDILHVAAASLLGARQFVSFDRRQRSLAFKAGLKILPRIMPKS
ncbi:MAG: type II toxin-antitoxin system VapC family toxin [Acidobacteriota bacterium]